MAQDRAPRPDPSAPSGGAGAPGGSVRIPAAAGSGPGLPPSNSVSAQGTYFLGRYRVVDEIGIGGMASVHLARMDGPGGFQKWVAIKRIHPHLIEDDSFIHMFLDEARIAARISHPNVATVFELGKHEDTYWIAMEYLHGEPLREVMRRTEEMGAPMPPEIACRVIADAAEGLHAAHELLGKNGEKLNLIHRDVTPHNLFVTYEGTTKVVDFGIAKFSSRMSSTRAGTLKGKLAYMSPEQVQGETIDRRTDIFALGVVLWELTTGQRLFRMDSDLDTLAKVQECNIPRPSSIVRGYPIDLEKIVMKALAKNRGERFKTAREFSRMLQSLLMRRGLFIASDEVANYIQSIFKDRIEKREAHLRWAGEVTQTINIEQLQAAGHPVPPEVLAAGGPSSSPDRSDVQASSGQARPPPRPAAGVPAAPPSREAVSRQSARLAAPPLAGPVSPRRSAPAHPPPSSDPRGPGAIAGRQPPPAPSTVPLPHVPNDDELDDSDDAPTVQATVAQVMAARSPVSTPAGTPYAGASGFDEDFEDVNDTIVEAEAHADDDMATSRPQQAPLPAAGRPAAPMRGGPVSSQRAPTTRPEYARGGAPFPTDPMGGPRTMPIHTVSPTGPIGPYAMGAAAGAPAYPHAPGAGPPLNISDPSLPQTLALPTSSLGPPLPMPPAAPPDSELGVVAAQPAPPGAAPRVVAPTVPRMFVPPSADQTQTARARTGNRAPWWAVAILAATAVFVVSGVIALLVTLFSSPSSSSSSSSPSTASGKAAASAASGAAPPAAAPVPSSAPTTTAQSPSPASSAPVMGVFTGARNGFLAAIAPHPTTAATPAPAPTPTAAPPDTASAAPPPPTPSATAAAADSAPTPQAAPQAPAAAPPDTTPSAPQAVAPNPPPTPQAGPAPQPANQAVNSYPVHHGGASTSPANAGSGGYLSVICLPACDQIFDNGKLLGPSPVFKRPATIGSHRIKLVVANPYTTKTISAIVQADQVFMVRESMP